MKKVFGIINLVCILISILFVGVNFYSKIDSGKNVHKAVSTFLSDSENSILVSEISDCSYFVDMRLTNLTSEQKEYLYELSTVLDRLNQLTTSISPRLLLNDSKSSSAYKIINNLENLTNERTLFLEETEKFKIKITGNLYGDTLTSINLYIKSFVNYLQSYNNSLQLLNRYLKSNNLTLFNTIEFYGLGIDYLSSNYKDLNFDNNAYQTIKELNTFIGIENSTNIVTATNSGLLSVDANNFNHYYSLSDKNDLIKKFYATLTNLSIDKNSNNTTLCIYYFYQIFEGEL